MIERAFAIWKAIFCHFFKGDRTTICKGMTTILAGMTFYEGLNLTISQFLSSFVLKVGVEIEEFCCIQHCDPMRFPWVLFIIQCQFNRHDRTISNHLFVCKYIIFSLKRGRINALRRAGMKVRGAVAPNQRN